MEAAPAFTIPSWGRAKRLAGVTSVLMQTEAPRHAENVVAVLPLPCLKIAGKPFFAAFPAGFLPVNRLTKALIFLFIICPFMAILHQETAVSLLQLTASLLSFFQPATTRYSRATFTWTFKN
jgi:hypothetical protein